MTPSGWARRANASTRGADCITQGDSWVAGVPPADANGVGEAWRCILCMRHEPVALVLSRQPMPTLDRPHYASAAGVARGVYALAAQVILLGTGTEVSLCLAAHERLVSEGIRSRVVSMPYREVFEEQDHMYRDSVLPPDVSARVAVEQASTFGWERYTGLAGRTIQDAVVWSIGAAQGAAHEVRLHGRCGRSRRQGDSMNVNRTLGTVPQVPVPSGGLGLMLDPWRMRLDHRLLGRMATPLARAFDATEALERARLPGPMKRTHGGYYWLRATDLAPNRGLSDVIVAALRQVHRFASNVHSGGVEPRGGT